LPGDDQAAVLNLARLLKLGENHFKDILDWLEEIALRDGLAIHELLQSGPLEKIWSDPRLSRNDKLKRGKDEIRRLRFPRLSKLEEGIKSRIQSLKLRRSIEVQIPAGLEGGQLTIQIKAGSLAELKNALDELHEKSKTKAWEEVFELLGGKRID